jgi:hypothetical protein
MTAMALATLSHIRSAILEKGIVTHGHLTVPAAPAYPFALLEIQEIWSSFLHQEKCCKIKWILSIYTEDFNNAKTLETAEALENFLDGYTFLIPEERNLKGCLKILGTLLESFSDQKKKKLEQTYEVWIQENHIT